MPIFDGKPLLDEREQVYLETIKKLGPVVNNGDGPRSSTTILCNVVLKLVDRVRVLEEYLEGEPE